MVGRLIRVLATGCAIAAFAGCTSGGAKPNPDDTGPKITVDTMRAALLQPTDIGETWQVPNRSPSTTSLVSFCAGLASTPPVPGSPAVATTSLADVGQKGAQSFDQAALVYDRASTATSGLNTLRGLADACPATASAPAHAVDDAAEAAYTETATTTKLTSADWSGFVVVRHKDYDPKNPGTADTAVAVLAKRNVILVAAYAIYFVGQHSISPTFTTDWQNLVGKILGRVTT
jgi:hypothetical protein